MSPQKSSFQAGSTCSPSPVYPLVKMKNTLACTVAFLATTAYGSLVFMVSTEPGDKGIQKSWVTDRWVCMSSRDGFEACQLTEIRPRTYRTRIEQEYFVGLCIIRACERLLTLRVSTSRCAMEESLTLRQYRDAGCNGTSTYIAKYKGDLCCPGDVNLTDVGFDKKASSWACY